MKLPFFYRIHVCFIAMLSGMVFFAISMVSQPAYALTAGCDPAKWSELQSLAEVRAAYDVGITEEVIPKPDSVLALTCFAQASQISADKGGSIFSGDFTANLNNVITDSLTGMLGNFAGSLLDSFLPAGMGGLLGGLFGGGAFTCDNMSDIWTDVLDGGITAGAKFLDLDDILDTSLGILPAGVGDILKENLQSGGAAAAATAVQAALAAAPIAIPTMDTDTNGNGHLDVCDVMRNLTGVNPPGC